MSTSPSASVKVVVSPDRLKVWVRVNPQSNFKGITREHLLATLQESKIAVTPDIQSRLEALFLQLQAGNLPGEDFLLAECPSPTDSVDAGFELSAALRPPSETETLEAGRVSHYERRTIISVNKGDVIGRIVPAKPGQPSVDVCGNVISPVRKPKDIALRGNVEMAGDGLTVVASCDGRVVFQDGRISVASVLEISGDVDFSTGHVDTPGDVVVHGSVKDLFRVRSSRDIHVDWHVDGALLEAGGDIIVAGGIHGHGKASIKAAGRIEAKICDGAVLEAGRTFDVQRECINCRISADRIVSPAGTIIGGYAWARNGIEVQTLGSPAGVKTVVSTGIPARVIDEAAQMVSQAKEGLEGATKIRATVGPLLQEMRRLSSQQRERATELLFEADQLEQRTRDLDCKREEMLEKSASQVEPSVLVSGHIHAGVTIAISGRATTLMAAIRGPIRILERKIDGVTTLVAVDPLTSSVRPLSTARFTAEAEKLAMEIGETTCADATPAAR
jgi:uncharacterized protein